MKDLLSYDPDTGVITWKTYRNQHARAGDVAGTPHSRGYLHIEVQGKKYKAHRIAWFLHYGEWPPEQLDHANGVKTDNRICNLRLASNSENQRNAGKQSNNKSGYKGASIHKSSGRWQATCCVNGKKRYLGLYDSPEEAHEAYCAFAEKHHKEFFRP